MVSQRSDQKGGNILVVPDVYLPLNNSSLDEKKKCEVSSKMVLSPPVVYFRILRLGGNYDSDTVLFDLTTWSPNHAIIIMKMDLQNQQDTNMQYPIHAPNILLSLSLSA